MDLAWFFIRKPKVEAHELPSEKPDPVQASDWAWAVMVTAAGCLTGYAVHTSPDSEYPFGRGPIYFWIIVAVITLAPAYLHNHFFGQKRGTALGTVIAFTAIFVGMFALLWWPASLQMLYAPLRSDTWTALEKRLSKPGGIAVAWGLFIAGLFAIGAWWSAWSVFASTGKTARDPQHRRTDR